MKKTVLLAAAAALIMSGVSVVKADEQKAQGAAPTPTTKVSATTEKAPTATVVKAKKAAPAAEEQKAPAGDKKAAPVAKTGGKKKGKKAK